MDLGVPSHSDLGSKIARFDGVHLIGQVGGSAKDRELRAKAVFRLGFVSGRDATLLSELPSAPTFS